MKLVLSRIGCNKEDVVASILLEDDTVQVETQDLSLKTTLETLMAAPICSRRPVGKDRGVLAFQEIILNPGTEDFFKEVKYALRGMGFKTKIEGTQKHFLIALDFDGVLWDSVHECFVIGHLAYLRMGGRFPATRTAEELFRSGRPFCRTAQDFYVVFRSLEESPNIDFERLSIQTFERLRQQYKEDSDKFEPIFYEERHNMLQKDPEGWASLQSPFPGILTEIDILHKNFAHVVIATTKDELSAKYLLNKHHLPLNVVAKETSCDKVYQMRHLSSTYQMPLQQLFFVDDLLEQVLHVRSIGVKSAMAAWGYNTHSQREAAKRAGVPLLEMSNLEKQISAIIGTEI